MINKHNFIPYEEFSWKTYKLLNKWFKFDVVRNGNELEVDGKIKIILKRSQITPIIECMIDLLNYTKNVDDKVAK